MLLFRGNCPVEVLDLIVKYKFELLQLLCLLFEPVDLLLSRADQLVTLTNLRIQVVSLLRQLRVNFILTVDEHSLFRDLPLQVANLCFDLNQLVLGKLQLSLTLETHILHVDLVRLVLLVNVFQLKLRVLLNLIDRLRVLFCY